MSSPGDIVFGPLTFSAQRPYLIAEAGVNYEGSLETAIEMVREAARAGADAIKFQSYKAETLASRNSPSYWDLAAEPTTSQFALFKKHDSFGDEEYRALARVASECGITFLSTPFDEHFVDLLDTLMPVFKIASADLTNTPFLRYVASKGKPIILSVGASTIGEIETALGTIRGVSGAPVALLHCILSYPCQPEDANLRAIKVLRRVFPDVVVGYSDHVPPHAGCLCLTTAWLLGARILEKHFTLDKTLPGNDHYHAMNPSDIAQFRIDSDYVTALLGEDDRRTFGCEASARTQARRSLVATRAIPAGSVVTREMLTTKRPGTGLAPGMIEVITGAKAIRPIAEDEILQWNCFIGR